jgi:hypothetical protein
MAKKIYTVTASCIALILTLAIVEPQSASAFDERQQQGHRHGVSRRHHNRAARKKAHRRHAVSYVCPMHPDMRASAPGTCPKCLMELVRKDAKPARRS